MIEGERDLPEPLGHCDRCRGVACPCYLEGKEAGLVDILARHAQALKVIEAARVVRVMVDNEESISRADRLRDAIKVFDGVTV